jgi:hypothetical protein
MEFTQEQLHSFGLTIHDLLALVGIDVANSDVTKAVKIRVQNRLNGIDQVAMQLLQAGSQSTSKVMDVEVPKVEVPAKSKKKKV